MRAGIPAVIGVALTSVAGCDRIFQLDHLMAPGPPDAAIDAAIDGPRPIALTRGMASDTDDAYQDSTKTLVLFSWVSLRDAGLWGAFRFELPEVPAGAEIQSATLEVVIDSDTEDSPVLSIWSEASSAPAAFTTAAGDLSNRARGLATVDWTAVDLGAGIAMSPPVTAIVQERVNDTSWATSTSLVLLLESRLGSNFECRQHDMEPKGSHSVRLHLAFVPPAPQP